MKKSVKVVLVSAVVMGMGFAASAKTWTNFVGFGFTGPTDLDADITNGKKESSMTFDNIAVDNQWGVTGLYMGVHENGFAVNGMFNVYTCDMSNTVKGFDFTNVGIDLLAGAGYAPIRNENWTVGVFGMVGITGATGKSDKKYVDVINCDAQYEHTYAAFECGLNVTAVYTPSTTFSVWGGLTGAYVTSGAYQWKSKYSSANRADTDTEYDTKSTYRFIPAVGICWKF